MIKIVNFINEVYAKNSFGNSLNNKNFALSHQYAWYTQWIIICTAIIYAFCILTIDLFSFITYFVTGAMITPSKNNYPGVDKSTVHGFTISTLFDCMLASSFYFIITSFDGLCFVIFGNMTMVASVITNYMDGLLDMLMNKKSTMAQRKQSFMNLIWMQLKYHE